SGTGKKTLAAAIHSWSARRMHPFVTVWCAALSEHRLESGLLDHLHGAMTGMPTDDDGRADAVRGGTLFFDEVGNGGLPPTLHVKLLGELETLPFGNGVANKSKESNARIIVATHYDLEADVRAGRLREDLFFQLSVVTIAIPPLRELQEDLPALCDHFLARLAAHYRRGTVRLTPDARRALAAYQW